MQASVRKPRLAAACAHRTASRVDQHERQIARRYDSYGQLKTNEFSNGYDARSIDSPPPCRPFRCTHACMHACRTVDDTRPSRDRSDDMTPRTLRNDSGGMMRFTVKPTNTQDALSGHGTHDDHGHGNGPGTTWFVKVRAGAQSGLHRKLAETGAWCDCGVTAASDASLSRHETGRVETIRLLGQRPGNRRPQPLPTTPAPARPGHRPERRARRGRIRLKRPPAAAQTSEG